MNVSFEWDAEKAKVNLKKHDISFEEACSVFCDQNAVEYYDTAHSIKEDRFLMLGLSENIRILLISYTVRKAKSDITIRIISARKATKKESKHYKG